MEKHQMKPSKRHYTSKLKKSLVKTIDAYIPNSSITGLKYVKDEHATLATK